MKKIITQNEIKTVNEDGNLHSYNDLPAYTYMFDYITCSNDKYRAWYKDGIRHRDNGPAIIHSDEEELFYIEGEQIFPTVSKRLFFRKKEIWFLK